MPGVPGFKPVPDLPLYPTGRADGAESTIVCGDGTTLCPFLLGSAFTVSKNNFCYGTVDIEEDGNWGGHFSGAVALMAGLGPFETHGHPTKESAALAMAAEGEIRASSKVRCDATANRNDILWLRTMLLDAQNRRSLLLTSAGSSLRLEMLRRLHRSRYLDVVDRCDETCFCPSIRAMADDGYRNLSFHNVSPGQYRSTRIFMPSDQVLILSSLGIDADADFMLNVRRGRDSLLVYSVLASVLTGRVDDHIGRRIYSKDSPFLLYQGLVLQKDDFPTVEITNCGEHNNVFIELGLREFQSRGRT